VRDEIRRMALITSGVVELTRNRAEAIVRDLIKSGDLQGSQASQAVRDLMERSRQNRDELLNLIRTELRNQVEHVGLATKRDVERLERRIARLENRAGAPTTAKKTHKKTAKKTHKKTTKKTTEDPNGEG
jgi:polyhydroxyalkanoate synthesis regulator phasin